ncbi:MAG: PQQ-binding-like beta-propeller repeat protein [Acidimicrobiales bacterium]
MLHARLEEWVAPAGNSGGGGGGGGAGSCGSRGIGGADGFGRAESTMPVMRPSLRAFALVVVVLACSGVAGVQGTSGTVRQLRGAPASLFVNAPGSRMQGSMLASLETGVSTSTMRTRGRPGRSALRELRKRSKFLRRVSNLTRSQRSVSSDNWLMYHGALSGNGFRSSPRPWPAQLKVGWRSSALRGQIYGEPLVDSGVIYVATEEDYLYAIALRSGAILWSRQLAQPVSVVGDGICGDISPYLGITSTPVIDAKRNEIFVVAGTRTHGFFSHHLIGVTLKSQHVELNVILDPPLGTRGFSEVSFDGFELQRAGLTIDHGEIVVSFGGNWGDCGTYHGFVVSVQVTNGRRTTYVMNHGAGNQDALWMGGAAPVVDPSGALWVTSGNGSSTSVYDQSNTVLRLSPRLTVVGSFYPANFAQLSSRDLDLGSGAPILLPDVGPGGSVLQVGKQGTGYLVPIHLNNGLRNGANVARSVTRVGQLCGDYGGAAVVSGRVQSVVYLPCASKGLLRVDISSTGKIQPAWTQSIAGGPPVVAGGFVWSISKSLGVLFQIDQATGTVVQQYPLGTIANSFPTPSVSGSWLIATSAQTVTALVAS